MQSLTVLINLVLLNSSHVFHHLTLKVVCILILVSLVILILFPLPVSLLNLLLNLLNLNEVVHL